MNVHSGIRGFRGREVPVARKSDGAKRARLVEKALEVFGDRGFRGTTIKRIAGRAGIAAGSVYTYFKDKDDLIRATLDEGWSAFLASLDALADAPGPFSRTLDLLLDTGFAELEHRLALVRAVVLEPDRRDALRGRVDELCRRVERIFAAARRARRPAREVSAWRTMLRVTVIGLLFTAATTPPERAGEQLRALKSAIRGVVMSRRGEAS
jgi:AcrR family transcriptional regulator